MEDVAFCNVVNRHRDYINARDLKKVAALTEADATAWAAGFKTCCDIQMLTIHRVGAMPLHHRPPICLSMSKTCPSGLPISRERQKQVSGIKFRHKRSQFSDCEKITKASLRRRMFHNIR